MTWLFFDTFPRRLRGRVEAESLEEATRKMGCKPVMMKGKNRVCVPNEISEYAGQCFELVPFDVWYQTISEIKEPWQLSDLLRKQSGL